MDLVEKLDHVAFAVRDKKAGDRFLSNVLGAQEVMDMEWGGFRFTSYLLGSASMLELVYADDPNHFVNRFIEKRGEGIHHIAIEVQDITAALNKMKAAGYRLIDETPRLGADNMLIAFVHPRSTNGVLLELCQHSKEE